MSTLDTSLAAKHSGNAALTVTEILAITAIISGAAALLLPSLSMARRIERRMACGGNERQIAMAWQAYLQDNDGCFPKGLNANVRYGGWRGLANWWPRPLNRYLCLDVNSTTEHDTRVFCCPADRGGIPGTFQYEKIYRTYGTSYQTNLFLVGPARYPPFSERTAELDNAISSRLDHLRSNEVTATPSRLLMLGDFGWVLQWAPPEHFNPRLKMQAEWHGRLDSHNMVFLDGHVGYQRLEKGFYVSAEYDVLPFEDLFALARSQQGKAPSMPYWNGVIDGDDFLRLISLAGKSSEDPGIEAPKVAFDWDLALLSENSPYAPKPSSDGYIDASDVASWEWLLQQAIR